jgi:NAD(P)-dependent dehydrogenase (short-subunit alcohol dehydrogenase family)
MSELVWFITGASRGFGLEIARAALERGDAVVAAARSPAAVERALGTYQNLFAVELDVTHEAEAHAATCAALERFGRIDVLVNNAGRGLLGAVEESSAAEVRSLFAVNVEGLLAVTRAVLPSMRARGSGTIVNISSVAGIAALPGFGIYSATKFAVEGLSEALAAELRPLGMHVMIVEPGAFRTDFLDDRSLHHTAERIDEYAETAGATRSWAEGTKHGQPGDPAKAAEAIIQAVTSDEPPTRLPLGPDCVARIEQKLADMASHLSEVRDVALSTDFPEAQANSPALPGPA